MATPAKAARVNSAIQVIQRMHEGMTAVDACLEIGLPRSTFYDIVKKNPEAFAEIQKLISINNHEQFLMVLCSQTQLLQKIIDDGLSDKTRIRDRLTIYMKLSDLLDNLMQNMEEQYQKEKRGQVRDYQTAMPELRVIKSRFST